MANAVFLRRFPSVLLCALAGMTVGCGTPEEKPASPPAGDSAIAVDTARAPDSDTEADRIADSSDSVPDIEPADMDGDGATSDVDCDDNDPSVYPGAHEVCDGKDNDCDGRVDERAANVYQDVDGDGYGDPATTACIGTAAHVDNGDDCDDADATIHPGATEVCDGVDNDCDRHVDEGLPLTYLDADGDGYGDKETATCSGPTGYVDSGTDCDDTDATIHPGATEVCDGKDNDCDGTIDSGAVDALAYYYDKDGDGYGETSLTVDACPDTPDPFSLVGGDCDDSDITVYPGAVETCDGVDNDCDGDVDEDATWYADADGDGYGDPDTSTSVAACDTPPAGYVGDASDCDDTDPAVYTSAPELCDGIDNDCDGAIDEDILWFEDADGDGAGALATGIFAPVCASPAGAVRSDTDCDDSDASTYPGAAEACDGLDHDCDGIVGDGVDCGPCGAASGIAVTARVPDDDATIQDAIDAASSGDAICVRAGTYAEALDFGGKDLVVFSEAGAEETVIDATGLDSSVVTFENGEGAEAVLQGFTLTGGSGRRAITRGVYGMGSGEEFPTETDILCGGGVYADESSPTLSDLIVSGMSFGGGSSEWGEDGIGPVYFSEYTTGGGLCFLDSDSELEGVTVSENSAAEGGAAYIDADSSISWIQGEISDNTAEDGGGIYLDGGELHLDNIISHGNASYYGALFFMEDGSATLTNLTSYEDLNTWSAYAVAMAYQDYSTCSLDLQNDIITDYAGGSGVFNLIDSCTVTGSYNLIYSPGELAWDGMTDLTGMDGNLSEDPELVDPADGDYHLTAGSPAIDAGDPDTGDNDVDGTRNDMGAYGGPAGAW